MYPTNRTMSLKFLEPKIRMNANTIYCHLLVANKRKVEAQSVLGIFQVAVAAFLIGPMAFRSAVAFSKTWCIAKVE